MRTEAEVKRAAALLGWYHASGRVWLQDRRTVDNIAGVAAAVEWVLGLDGVGQGKDNPVAGTLADIGAMMAGPERN